VLKPGKVVMLFRAVFWIGVGALLTPCETGTISASAGASQKGAAVIEAPSSFRDSLFARLAALSVEIEAAEAARAARGG
jgi:hypothetical protein